MEILLIILCSRWHSQWCCCPCQWRLWALGMFQFIDFSWSEYTGSLWIDEPFGDLCCPCLSFMPLRIVLHPISLSFLCCLSLPVPLSLFCLSTLGFLATIQKRHRIWMGPQLWDWIQALKHGSCYGSWGGPWWWLCVCVLRGSHVEAEGKYSFGHCCRGLPL